MKKLIIISIGVFFLLSGCGPASAPFATIDPLQSQLAATNAAATPNSAEAPALSPTANSEAGLPAGGTAAALQTATSGALTVQVFSESVVEVAEPQYTVSGSAPKGTVLSINDNILVVDSGQVFNVLVPLEEGPNLVEILASNAAGDQVSFELAIIYTVQ